MQSARFFTLNNGMRIPQIGLGTFSMKGQTMLAAARSAKSIGFQYFDTSPAYGNEADLAAGLYKSRFPFRSRCNRKKYLLQTKLFLNACISHKERQGLLSSLKKMNTDYMDIYLMHWAYPDTFVRNWQAMEMLYHEGLAKAIGVCNMEVHHLKELLDHCTVIPAINHVEVTPLLTQKPLSIFCQEHNIHIQAYTPFARMDEKLFKNTLLNTLAEKYGRRITQILIRWNIQEGRSVIPKSQKAERQQENLHAYDFELSAEDIVRINGLNENFRFRHHPDVYPLDWRKQRERQ